MQYDPIKRSLGRFFNASPFLRKFFYRLLDLLLLRTWHIKKNFRLWAKSQKSAAILDAGMGFGQYAYFMARSNKNFRVKGVDVKEEQVSDCQTFFEKINQKNASFEFADLTTFCESNSYDFILSVDVMEHIEEDVLVFKNFHSSLKPGGMLLISTPSDQGGSDVHRHEQAENSSFIDEHVRDGYGTEEIKEKLRLAGFLRSETYYSYGWPGNISWKISMKYPILLLNLSKLFFVFLPIYYLIVFPFALILNWADLNFKHKTGTGLIVKAWK
jgi:SAM-dependent methyltransferase